MVKRFLILILTGACVIAPPAEAAKKKHTCRSGSTIYKHNGVRVFEDGGFNGAWFACGPRSRRPTPLYSSEASYGQLSVFGRDGEKVLFVAEFSGEGGGEDTTVGYFDARTSTARSGDLAGGGSNVVRDLVVAPDGGIGVVSGVYEDSDAGVTVGYLAPSARKLRDELVLSLAGKGYVERSLAFASGSLTWRAGEQTRSAPLAGETITCTSGTTLIESDGARVFEVFPRRKTDRGFQADVLAGCDAGSATPRELAVADVHDQWYWEPRALKRAGSRVAFLAGYRGIGLLDGGTVRFATLDGLGGLDDVAVGPTGDVVFAGLSGEGGFSQRMIARWTGGKWERLAAQGGDLVDDSLAVGDDGRVTWQTKDGFAQAVPLAGETTIDCQAGTTLLDRDGWRVFEVMPAGGADIRLYGCAPGIAPVQLATASRTGSWKAVVLAREQRRRGRRDQLRRRSGAQRHARDLLRLDSRRRDRARRACRARVVRRPPLADLGVRREP